MSGYINPEQHSPESEFNQADGLAAAHSEISKETMNSALGMLDDLAIHEPGPEANPLNVARNIAEDMKRIEAARASMDSNEIVRVLNTYARIQKLWQNGEPEVTAAIQNSLKSLRLQAYGTENVQPQLTSLYVGQGNSETSQNPRSMSLEWRGMPITIYPEALDAAWHDDANRPKLVVYRDSQEKWYVDVAGTISELSSDDKDFGRTSFMRPKMTADDVTAIAKIETSHLGLRVLDDGKLEVEGNTDKATTIDLRGYPLPAN